MKLFYYIIPNEIYIHMTEKTFVELKHPLYRPNKGLKHVFKKEVQTIENNWKYPNLKIKIIKYTSDWKPIKIVNTKQNNKENVPQPSFQ